MLSVLSRDLLLSNRIRISTPITFLGGIPGQIVGDGGADFGLVAATGTPPIPKNKKTKRQAAQSRFDESQKAIINLALEEISKIRFPYTLHILKSKD